MISEKILVTIEELINIIYSPDQNGFDRVLLQILDMFDKMIQDMLELGYTVDMTEELLPLQNAYMKKDYVELADILLYDIKPKIQEILCIEKENLNF